MVSERALEIAVVVEGRDRLMKVKRMAVSFVLLASLVLSAMGQEPGTRFPVRPDRWTAGPDAD